MRMPKPSPLMPRETPKRPTGQFAGQREITGKVNGPGMGAPQHPKTHKAFEKL